MNMKFFEEYRENVRKRDGRQDRGVSCRSGSSVFCNNRTHIAALLFPTHQGSLCEEQQPNQRRSFTAAVIR